MNLSEPKTITFWIAVVLFILGLAGQFAVAALAPYAVWLFILAFIILALGNLIKNM